MEIWRNDLVITLGRDNGAMRREKPRLTTRIGILLLVVVAFIICSGIVVLLTRPLLEAEYATECMVKFLAGLAQIDSILNAPVS